MVQDFVEKGGVLILYIMLFYRNIYCICIQKYHNMDFAYGAVITAGLSAQRSTVRPAGGMITC